jgi:hypothetical protein
VKCLFGKCGDLPHGQMCSSGEGEHLQEFARPSKKIFRRSEGPYAAIRREPLVTTGW